MRPKGMRLRPCNQCGLSERPIKAFGACGRCYDRSRYILKRRPSHQRWIAANRDRWNAYQRERYWDDPERARERNRRWNATHPEVARKHARQWRRDNPKKRAAQSRRRYALKRAMIDLTHKECLDLSYENNGS